MTPATLAERKTALAQAVERTRGDLSKVLVQYVPQSPEHAAISGANVRLTELLHRCNVLSDGLQPYMDPNFYKDLPPSLALEDQGQHARNRMEQAFPE